MRIAIINSLLAAALLGLAGTAQAACNSATIAAQAPDSRYSYLAGGSEVLDIQTNLVWARCTIGQVFDDNATPSIFTDDSCTGAVSPQNWQEAVESAVGSLHLPNVKELTSLIETQCSNPAINETIFPATSAAAYWSSTPDTAVATNAWQVDFAAGGVGSAVKTNAAFVRLVRENP